MKYFLGFLVCIALIVVVFILILKGFSGGKPPKDQVHLVDYATTDTAMQLTMDGPVVADEKHLGYRITVNSREAKIEVYQGYQNKIIKSQTYVNNQDAYLSFLRALDIAGYTKGTAAKKTVSTDERGVCANGTRTIYETLGTRQTSPQRTWGTSCGGGTFKGNAAQVRQLFTRQIPDFSKLTSGVNLTAS